MLGIYFGVLGQTSLLKLANACDASNSMHYMIMSCNLIVQYLL